MVVAVCDDCYKDRQRMSRLIEEYSSLKNTNIVVEEYSSDVELCCDMEQLRKYSIIFLGINMGQESGLQTAKKIKNIYPELSIVLVTEFLGYALEGYRVNASRFLVKTDLDSKMFECLDEIIDEIKRKSQKLVFSFVEGSIELEIQKIIYIETNRHKNVFHTADYAYGLYKKLDDIERELAQYGFIRVHQSFLVNMRYVEKISSYIMRLTTGKEISVPKSRYPNVKREFAVYKGT